VRDHNLLQAKPWKNVSTALLLCADITLLIISEQSPKTPEIPDYLSPTIKGMLTNNNTKKALQGFYWLLSLFFFPIIPVASI
jgi:hypothetical protein